MFCFRNRIENKNKNIIKQLQNMQININIMGNPIFIYRFNLRQKMISAPFVRFNVYFLFVVCLLVRFKDI